MNLAFLFTYIVYYIIIKNRKHLKTFYLKFILQILSRLFLLKHIIKSVSENAHIKNLHILITITKITYDI